MISHRYCGCAQHVHDTYWLVNVVDNAYADDKSDVFSVFRGVVWDNMDRDGLMEVARSLDRDNGRLREQLQRLSEVNVSVVTHSIWPHKWGCTPLLSAAPHSPCWIAAGSKHKPGTSCGENQRHGS